MRSRNHGLEPVVPIDEGEIELPAVGEETGEQNLRLLAVELDEVANTGLLQHLNPDAGVCRPTRRSFNELVRVGGDMTPPGPFDSNPSQRNRVETAKPRPDSSVR
jgi:hypothetical protein